MSESYRTEQEQNILFPEEGLQNEALITIGAIHAANRIRRDTVHGFYEPFIEPEIADLQTMIQLQGHDLFSSFGYEGTASYIDKCIRSLESSFLGWNDACRGGTVLPSATIAIHHALQIALSEYSRSIDHDYYTDGLPTNHKLVVIAPIHASFLLERACQSSGLGRNAVRYYELSTDYKEDLGSLRQTLLDCHHNNETVVLNFMFGGGDTIRGLPQDIPTILDTIEKMDSQPYNVADGAAHLLNAWATQTLDVRDPRIDAAIVNPQKVGFPLGGTLFFLRDARQLGSFVGKDYSTLSADRFEELRLQIQAQGTWLISRDASAAMTFFAALMKNGTNWFREERLRAHENAHYFRARLQSHPDTFTPITSGNTIVPFLVRGHSSATRTVAEIINHSNEAFISYDAMGRVRNTRDLQAAQGQLLSQTHTDYDCLWANFYPFQSLDDIERFFAHVYEAATVARTIHPPG